MKRYRKVRKNSRSKSTIVAMGQKYEHLSYEDRVKIEHWRKRSKSIRYIANELGRSPSTISYELKHLTVSNEYVAKKASVKAYQKRYYARTSSNKVAGNKVLRQYVDDGLDKGWSPGEIAGSSGCPVSKRTIYRYVNLYALQYKLYFRGKPKQRKAMYRHGLIGERKWIEERILRDEVGHFELDFIVSPTKSGSKAVLLVTVDTLSKRTLIELLPNRTKQELSQALGQMFDGVAVKTILTDNDIAFTYWKHFEQLLGAPLYFTHPYHSWEKGLVENTNKWIRHFIPKTTNLETVTKETIVQVLMYLNDRPRQVLGYKTANEVYLEYLTIQG
ncbi:IS30 family transposase [Candidatus Saccharibacteria bacterium]|nr:IS30 family transposase [Candidatus Saccharibacteria bacterium]NCU40251.1 IS30 family transposase [Candidatus Saccharibacteria bacterium]